MTVNPGTYNITIQRRATFRLDLQLSDAENVAIDLNYAIVISQIWNKERTRKYADFAITYPDPSDGKVSLSLTPAETETLPVEAFYDVLLVEAGDEKHYYLEGKVTVSQGYSA